MQTRRVKNYARYSKVPPVEEETLFVLSEGKEVAVVASFRSDAPFNLYYRTPNGDVPVACEVMSHDIDDRLIGVSAVVMLSREDVFCFVESKAIGIAPMDTTPMEITSQLPAPTMEEQLRRMFNKRFPPARDKKAEENFDAEDEVLVRAGGADYSIDDEDPDDPLEVTAADVAVARSRKRKRASDGVQPVDGGSDTGKDTNRGGSAESPPVEPSDGGEPKA